MMYVACQNTTGKAVLLPLDLQPKTDLTHLDEARAQAKKAGYAPPYIVFDKPEDIAQHVASLDCAIPIPLRDCSGETDYEERLCKLKIGWDGLCVSIEGYSDCTSDDDYGYVAFIENYENEAMIRVYADINREEPTHSIGLSDARNEHRVD